MRVLLLATALLACVLPAAADDREALRTAEIDFARALAAKDLPRFSAFIAPDAVFVNGGTVLRGKDEILAAWKLFFSPDAPELRWHPEVAELAADGALGLTRGPWTLRSRAPDGSATEQQGVFNSMWRKTPEGWRVTFDAGCAPCAPAAPAETK